MKRLAIIASHPVQYIAPWFRLLATTENLTVKVFYLWDFGVTELEDVGFRQKFKWDIPLLDGYDHEFVQNRSKRPGTDHFSGLINPDLTGRVRSFAPDAVLLFGYNYASFIRFIFDWRKTGIPLLFRGDSHRIVRGSGIKEWLRRRLISLVFKNFDVFLYVGMANREYFRYHYVPEEKLFFAPHAVDNERFFAQQQDAEIEAASWKKGLGIPVQHRVILFSGKFEEKKRPFDLFSAFLQANLADVSLLFVGAGRLEHELRRQASLHPHVFFTPFQNQTFMPRTYAAADVVVLPSFGPAESWGLAINEAMCLSRPVIVSSHVGCAQDLVHHGRNGLIFPAGDIEALAACLEDSFSDIMRLRSWGEESRKIIENYSYEQMTNGLLETLTKLGVLSQQNK